MTDDIMISIICNTFNHEKYIKDALDGFLMQKTNFNFEVLVHDDASTDLTADIIREYEKTYPNIIKPIYETENQYSLGNGMIMKIQRQRIAGKYIAICEGDDYWTDPLKLQKQVDILESHPEIDICAHTVQREKEGILGKYVKPSETDCIFSENQVILGGGGFVGTNSLVYRSKLEKSLPKFRQNMSLDYLLQIHGALAGGMYFLKDCMSVYRLATPGSWTVNVGKNIEKNTEHSINVMKVLDIFNKETNYKYNFEILYRKKFISRQIAIELHHNKYKNNELFEKYKEYYQQLTFHEKIKLALKDRIYKVLSIKR